MSTSSAFPAPRRLRDLSAHYLLPIGALLTLSFAALFGLLLHFTIVQDRIERARESALVKLAVDRTRAAALRDLQDYAIWDDAARNLVLRYDEAWAASNLGPYLAGMRGYDMVLVLDGAGRQLYTYRDGRRVPAFDAVKAVGPGFGRAIATLRAVNPVQPILTDFSRGRDGLHVFAAGRVRPLSGALAIPGGRAALLVIVRRIDQGFIDTLGRDLGGPRLHRISGAAPEGWDRLPIIDRAGREIDGLTWRPRVPGEMLWSRLWPAFLAVVLLSLGAAALVVSRGRRTLEALRLSEARAQHHAMHDLLTGFANRRAVQQRLEAVVRESQAATMFYLDLDGFKDVNDVYGHGTGDELLRAVAARLRQRLDDAIVAGRVGGDEFALLRPEEGDAAAAEFAQWVLDRLAQPFALSGCCVSIGVSIGIVSTAPALSVGEIMRRADVAMYAAKSNGKHAFRFYDPSLDIGRELRRSVEDDLRQAIERHEIGVVFQPIVAARGHEIVGVEALARWTHPVHGVVPPAEFIPIAEESGLIAALGRNVLTTACLRARAWNLELSVNLSPAQFWDRDLVRTVRAALASTGFPPQRLELEITEGYLLRRPDAAREVLDGLRALGVRISLDDFGTGFASIGYLQKLAFDRIKIDRSFVAAAARDQRAAEMARAIVAIGDALRLPVTAEGVETEAQAALMHAAGCSRLQGWLFGHPMSAGAMDRLLLDQAHAHDRVLMAE